MSANIFRDKAGSGTDTLTGKDYVMFVQDRTFNSNRSGPPSVAYTTSPQIPGESDLVVRKGYRYFVSVSCNSDISIESIKVNYR